MFCLPFMTVIQNVAAQIGSVTGRGIAANLRRHYPKPLLWVAVALLLVANVINLGADLSAMGAAMDMLMPGPILAYTLGFGLLCMLLEIFLSYERYAAVLKFTTLSLFAYVAVVFTVHIPWGEAIRSLLIPRVEWTGAFATGFVAILGTTISPYLFFWQAAQEVEEIDQVDEREPLVEKRVQGPDALSRIRWDTFTGMAVSNIVALAIMLGTAATLHAAGKHDIQSAADAAQALKPVAGNLAFALFSLGIIGTGLLAVPVLAGSSAYAISDIAGWKASLEHKPYQDKAFYAVIALGMALGLTIDWLKINPMSALFWSAVVNGVVAVPVLAGLMIVVSKRSIMDRFVASPSLKFFGWLATAVMGAAAVAMVLFPS